MYIYPRFRDGDASDDVCFAEVTYVHVLLNKVSFAGF